MITFIVPVKSKKVSSDWPRFCKLFQRTVKSICGQTDKNFRLVAVCHEVPEIDFNHKNLVFLEVEFNPPIPKAFESEETFNKRREVDKGEKIMAGVAYAKKNFDTDYVMMVDSDDCISNRIASFVNGNDQDSPGWYLKFGYIHLDGKKFLASTSKFSYLCGSSIIVKPDLIHYFFGTNPDLYFDHQLKTLDKGTNLSELPFFGGIYSMANGDNHYMSLQKAKNLNNPFGRLSRSELKRMYRKLRAYRFHFITRRIRDEFNFYQVTQ